MRALLLRAGSGFETVGLPETSQIATQKNLDLPTSDALSQSTEFVDSLRSRGTGRTVSIAALVAAIILWGANWPVMKIGLAHVSPLWFSTLRFATGAACLIALQAARGELRLPKPADWPFVASIGVFQMMAFTALGAAAMTHLPAGRSAILSYTTPLWVAPASVLIFKERMHWLRLVGIGIAGLGVTMLINPLSIAWTDTGVLRANAMLLAASLCWAACILHLRHFKSVSSAYSLAPWQMLLAGTALSVMAFAVEGPFSGDGTSAFWASLGFVGPIATAFCFCAVNAASTWMPATGMSIAMLGVPLTGVAISVMALGEALTPALICGSLSIVIGIAINAVRTRSHS